jgi:hypothetical protein
LLVEAAVRGHYSIVAVEDKGPSRGAIVYTEQHLKDAESGEPFGSRRNSTGVSATGQSPIRWLRCVSHDDAVAIRNDPKAMMR